MVKPGDVVKLKSGRVCPSCKTSMLTRDVTQRLWDCQRCARCGFCWFAGVIEEAARDVRADVDLSEPITSAATEAVNAQIQRNISNAKPLIGDLTIEQCYDRWNHNRRMLDDKRIDPPLYDMTPEQIAAAKAVDAGWAKARSAAFARSDTADSARRLTILCDSGEDE